MSSDEYSGGHVLSLSFNHYVLYYILYINRVYVNATLTSLSAPVNVELLSKPVRATGNNVAKGMLLLGCSSKSAIAQNERLVSSPTLVKILHLQPATIMRLDV